MIIKKKQIDRVDRNVVKCEQKFFNDEECNSQNWMFFEWKKKKILQKLRIKRSKKSADRGKQKT